MRAERFNDMGLGGHEALAWFPGDEDPFRSYAEREIAVFGPSGSELGRKSGWKIESGWSTSQQDLGMLRRLGNCHLSHVHDRTTDELGDEHVGWMGVDLMRVPTCCSTPSCITTIRSASDMASTWSWVT